MRIRYYVRSACQFMTSDQTMQATSLTLRSQATDREGGGSNVCVIMITFYKDVKNLCLIMLTSSKFRLFGGAKNDRKWLFWLCLKFRRISNYFFFRLLSLTDNNIYKWHRGFIYVKSCFRIWEPSSYDFFIDKLYSGFGVLRLIFRRSTFPKNIKL